METLTIDLINPKVKTLLMNLMELELINIRNVDTKSKLQTFFDEIRADCDDESTMDEKVAEVKIVRQERCDTKIKNN